MVIAIVGAGGKTTLVHQLRNQYLTEGKKVFVTTTTHMLKEADTLVNAEVQQCVQALNDTNYCMAGVDAGFGKIAALPEAMYQEICKAADVVLVEADGARHMPLKVPAEWEPVIPSGVDKIIVVAGLHGLGKKACEAVFRYELSPDKIEKDTVIEAEQIQRLIRKGYLEPMKKNYPTAQIQVEATQADNLYKSVIAEFLAENKDLSIIKKEWFDSCGTLIICGGGHVSQYVAKMARLIDFNITVIDDREEFVTKERFPEAAQRICCDYNQIETYLPELDKGFYVVVTRGHSADEQCVETILKKKYAYLGMIGSHKKVATIMDNLRNKGFTQEELKRIYSPIGLSIGARTPAEIAVSICAEIIEVKNKGIVSTMTSELAESTEQGVLCIILEKKGSSPRGVGSMMLVTKDKIIGTIGGGLIEKLAIDYAATVTGICEKEYTLTNEESAGMGMICGGWNKVLFVPVNRH